MTVGASAQFLRDRVTGSFVAGACGDALGAPVEFAKLADLRRDFGEAGVRDITGSGFTDDTQMALFTAEALVLAFEAQGDVLEALRRAYLRWLVTQGEALPQDEDRALLDEGALFKDRRLHVRRAPGNTCLAALRSGGRGTLREPINDSKGCGGVMRVAPIGAVLPPALAFDLAARAAALTHGHPSGYLSAGYLAACVSALVRGVALNVALAQCDRLLENYEGAAETQKALRRARDLAAAKTPSSEQVELVGAGWTGEECLAIAVYCVLATASLEEAVVLSVMHGGDSDSTGAVCGNLAGALYGAEAVPARWLAAVPMLDVVLEAADRLASIAR